MGISLYHPLNGNELLKWILHELERNLSEHYVFGLGMAYHNPTFNLNLKITAHNAAGYAENDVLVTLDYKKVTDPTILATPQTERKEFELSTSEPLIEPDRAREAMGEPRYVTEKVSGVMVDTKTPTAEPHTPEELKKVDQSKLGESK